MRDLKDLTHPELEAFVAEQGESRFRADQLFQWIHFRRVGSFDDMTNMPRSLRERLARVGALPRLTVDEVQESRDGTRKLRLLTHDGHAIESVLIPDGDKTTQCISSQVGCALDCDFC